MSGEDYLDILQDISRLLTDAPHNQAEDFNLTHHDHIPLMKAEDNLYTVKYLVEGVLMFCSGCLGVISNIVSVVFFVRQRGHRTFHRLLLLLAVVDIVHLVTSLLSFSLPTLSTSFLNNTYQYTLPYTLPLAQTSMMMSVYMTISLTVERYMSVVHPLLSRRHQSFRSCLYLAAPGMIFSLLFTLPNYFALHTEATMDKSNFLEIQKLLTNDFVMNSEVTQPRMKLVWAKWRNNKAFITVYVLWLHLIFLILFPTLLLFRLNKTIHRKLSENISSVRRTSHETLRRRELRLARVSLCIVFLYMACHTPKLVLTMCEIVYQDTKIIPGMFEISHLLLVLNCSLNFPIYFVASGSRFRNIFSTWSSSRSTSSSSAWRTRSPSSSMCSKTTLLLPLQIIPLIQTPSMLACSTSNTFSFSPLPQDILSSHTLSYSSFYNQTAFSIPKSNDLKTDDTVPSINDTFLYSNLVAVEFVKD